MRTNRFFLLLLAALPLLPVAAVAAAERASGPRVTTIAPSAEGVPAGASSGSANVGAVVDDDDSEVSSLRRRAGELKREVDRLRAENDRLRKALEESSRRKVEVRAVPSDRPQLPDGRQVPPDWIRREGAGVWHYLVPLTDNAAPAAPTKTQPAKADPPSGPTAPAR